MLKQIAIAISLFCLVTVSHAGLTCQAVNAQQANCVLIVDRVGIYAPLDTSPSAATFRLFGLARVNHVFNNPTIGLEIQVGNYKCLQVTGPADYRFGHQISGSCLLKLPLGSSHSVVIKSWNDHASADGVSAWTEIADLH